MPPSHSCAEAPPALLSAPRSTNIQCFLRRFNGSTRRLSFEPFPNGPSGPSGPSGESWLLCRPFSVRVLILYVLLGRGFSWGLAGCFVVVRLRIFRFHLCSSSLSGTSFLRLLEQAIDVLGLDFDFSAFTGRFSVLVGGPGGR